MDSTTIAGIASGMGGGIGIIRISGDMSLFVIGKIFRKDRDCKKNISTWDEEYFIKSKSHTVHYGYIFDGDNLIDEVIVIIMKSPRSYTREDIVEIDSHGGALVVQKILETVIKNGAVLATPGEFTKRAFLNGRIDLSQAEAVMKMISSKSEFALDSAIKQLEGSVSLYIEDIRQKILHDIGMVEAALDDPEHYDIDDFRDELTDNVNFEIKTLDGLLKRFNDGRMKTEGINTVIVGKPNAGKSSLMNLLLDEERAIVTNIAGTTRDILEETVYIGNIVLNLIDTAGIHETEDIVESVGVSKAVEFIDRSDLILFVVDSSQELDASDEQIISLLKGKTGVILFNKTDLPSVIKQKDIVKRLNWDCIKFSNETKDGLRELEDYIKNSFLNGNVTYNDQIYITSVRHKKAVEDALESLKKVSESIEYGMPEDFLTIDMFDAYQKLGLINGETATEDLINKIFSEFCMGK